METIEETKQRWKTIQQTLKSKLILADILTDINTIKYVGGVDLSFIKKEEEKEDTVEVACAAIVVLEYPSLKLVYEDYEMVILKEPYISGFLAFREVPHLVKLFRKLETQRPELKPDLIFVDGNGILHPERFGSACHLGVSLDIPTIGIAKNLMQVDNLTHKDIKDRIEKECVNENDCLELKGSSGELLGYAIPNKPGTKRLIYVSAGHKISARMTLDITRKCSIYRIPEPIRKADLGSRDYIRSLKAI